MKIIKVLIFALFISPAYAEMFKCKINGKISYQDTACQAHGSIFKKKFDVSVDQQKAVVATLNDQVNARREIKLQAEITAQRERSIRAKEENAFATNQNTKQLKRQTTAFEKDATFDRNRAFRRAAKFLTVPIIRK